ncbi:MAG: shikimate kinase [Proteobacteria bacterium]|nr:shikimate kinase [Pseudomonadota bacterium]
MTRPNIILTGFMGSGKTTVGKLLARQLGYDFIDTDHLIEQRCGMTVQELFQTKGEKIFRIMEADIARELGAGQGMVVSTGGKLMLEPENAQALSASGSVFCLVASPEETLRRVSVDKGAKRPLLDTANPMDRIVGLLQERQVYYNSFCQIVTTGKFPEEVTENVLEIFRAQPDLNTPGVTQDL